MRMAQVVARSRWMFAAGMPEEEGVCVGDLFEWRRRIAGLAGRLGTGAVLARDSAPMGTRNRAEAEAGAALLRNFPEMALSREESDGFARS